MSALCRHIEGFDFDKLTTKVHRNGAAVADLPTINGKVMLAGDHFLDRDLAMTKLKNLSLAARSI